MHGHESLLVSLSEAQRTHIEALYATRDTMGAIPQWLPSHWTSPYGASMTTDETSSPEDSGADESETLEDVDHVHPETGETFDQTGVHSRGQKHPDDHTEGSTDESDDTS